MEANSQSDSAAAKIAKLNDQLRLLTKKANGGDIQALAEMRVLLDEHPEVVRHVGDLARLAERVWIDCVANGDELVKETVRRQVDELKSELGGEEPMPLEKLLIENIAVCNLAEKHAEMLAAEPDSSSKAAILRMKRAESAQRRFLASIKTLALVRNSMSKGLVPSQTLKLFDPSRKAV